MHTTAFQEITRGVRYVIKKGAVSMMELRIIACFRLMNRDAEYGLANSNNNTKFGFALAKATP